MKKVQEKKLEEIEDVEMDVWCYKDGQNKEEIFKKI